jgi:hypothetical protein
MWHDIVTNVSENMLPPCLEQNIWILEMKIADYSEILIPTYQTIQSHIQETMV